MRSVTERLSLAIVIASAVAPGLGHAQACHHGVVGDDAIAWETRTGAGALVSGESSVESIEGGSLERGAIRPQGGSTVRVRTRQAIDGTLRPPLVRGPQRITLSSAGGEPVTFEPHVDGPLERHVGYTTTGGLDRAARRQIDDVCGRAEGIPLYVEAAGPIVIEGALSRPSERRETLLWVGGALLLTAGVGGGMAYRRLRDRAAVEQADALLEERYRALDQSERSE
jgi:hypothetical protein